MEYVFSNRIAGLKPSAIREILKVTQNKNIIPFAAGNPAPEAFPVAQMSEISARIFRDCKTAPGADDPANQPAG